MSAVLVTIRGTLYDLQAKTSRQVVLQGEASLTGLGIGGGPIIPDEPGQPPGIWGGGNEPFPTPPIHLPPGTKPPGQPPGIWGGGNEPFPTPPIYFPPNPPDPPDAVKPPPPDGGWAYWPEYGWGYFPKPGQPSPKG